MFSVIILQSYAVIGAVVAAIPSPDDLSKNLAGWEKVAIAAGLLMCIVYFVRGVIQAGGSSTKRGEGIATAIVAAIGFGLITAGAGALAGAFGF